MIIVDRLYNRVWDIERLWRNIKFRWKLLSYRDKYKNGGGDKQTSSNTEK